MPNISCGARLRHLHAIIGRGSPHLVLVDSQVLAMFARRLEEYGLAHCEAPASCGANTQRQGRGLDLESGKGLLICCNPPSRPKESKEKVLSDIPI